MEKVESALTHCLEILLAIVLFTIVFIVVLLVVMRYVFNASITGANELVTIFFVYSTAIGAAIGIGKREHISIPFAIDALPRRAQVIVDLFGVVLVAILNAIMFFYSLGWIQLTGNFLMPSTGFPRVVVQLSVPIGSGLALMYCFFRLILGFQTNVPKEDELPSEPGGSAE